MPFLMPTVICGFESDGTLSKDVGCAAATAADFAADALRKMMT